MILAAVAFTLVANMMKTPWTDKVNPQKPLPEYPRPTMERAQWLNLNGRWDFSTSGGKSGQITVPFPIESLLSGVHQPLAPSEVLTYRREVQIPKAWRGRTRLHFGAVDWEAEVRIDGTSVARHQGGFDPFFVDIAEGKRSFIVEVLVTDPTDTKGQPRGKQVLKPEGIWYTPTSGIWQTVWMEPLPERAIERYLAVPDLKRGGVHVTVFSEREGMQVEADIPGVGKAGFFTNRSHFIAVPNAKLWSPESPHLYTLNIRLLSGTDTEDAVKGYFGMREMTLGKDKYGVTRLLLNGKPYFQFGPLDQGYWPDGLYTAPTDAALRFDIEAAKKMGCNMLRKHVKVEPERFYTWCDKMGILVWQDMPSGDFPDKEGGKKAYEAEWKAIVRSRLNHPCVVMWVPFNEGWGQYDTERITEMTRKLDPSRLIDNPSGWTDKGVGDVIDIHSYPGPNTPPWEPNRAAVLGEFGGLGLPVEGHTWVQKNNWGYVSYKSKAELTEAYVASLKRLRDLIPLGLSAAVYTQTTDVEIEVNGWLTYDRQIWKIQPKDVLAVTKDLYKATGTVETIAGPQAEWRYTMSAPGAGWMSASFDDSAWKSGKASFGTVGTPNAHVATTWDTPDIWVRRSFEFAGNVDGTKLMIYHDEDADVYLNGVLAASLKGYTTGFIFADISADAQKALKPGRNVIAVHCRQTRGGQNLDCAVVRVRKG